MEKNIEFFISNEYMKTSTLIRQPYRATVARHSLNVHQHRILTRIFEKLQPEMRFQTKLEEIESYKENKILKFKLCDLMVRGKNHTQLKLALKNLSKKPICFKKKDEDGHEVEICTFLFVKTIAKKFDDSISIEIDRDVLPFLISLAGGYTKYIAEVSFNTSSVHTMRIYQYVAQFRDKKQTSLKVEKLKSLLSLEDKYKDVNNLRKRILLPAQKELEKKADVFFEIKENILEGRKVIGWILLIKKSNKIVVTEQKKEAKKSFSLDQIKLEKRLIKSTKLGVLQAYKVVEWAKNDEKKIKEIHNLIYEHELLVKDGKIKKIGPYTLKVLKEQFGIKF